jgi:hypothetical protein
MKTGKCLFFQPSTLNFQLVFRQDEQDEQDGDGEDEKPDYAPFLHPSTFNFQPYFRQDEQDGDEV